MKTIESLGCGLYAGAAYPRVNTVCSLHCIAHTLNLLSSVVPECDARMVILAEAYHAVLGIPRVVFSFIFAAFLADSSAILSLHNMEHLPPFLQLFTAKTAK